MSGRAGRWVVVYQAGPLGIAEGGGLYLQVSPFWGWSSPQVEQRGLPGFTVVELDPDSAQDDVGALRLDAARLGDQLLGIQVSGRPLLPGERVRIDYGAGLAGAMSDKYAERAERFWVAVDGDGDGVRTVLPESPVLDVQPGPAAGLVLTLPSTLRPGETGRLTLAAVDARGNAGVELEGQVELEVFPSDGLELPGSMGLAAVDQGSLQLPFRAPREGLFLVQARGPKGLLGESNPLLVSEQAPRVLWGDLHGHSNLSDGTGTPADYYRYAREVAGLDFAALTDHDHWGMLFLDQNEAIWQQVLDVNRQQHEPGRFVTLLGFEWTSWIHGHRTVLYFEDEGEVYSSLDPRYESPLGLWEALRGRRALTMAHHTGGGPIPTNWEIPPDAELEPLVEVSSVHGVSEALDASGVVYSPVPGHFARDALLRGYQLGLLGSGDSHDGHPGLAQLAGPQGGLVAVVGAELSRASLLDALRARRVYATNGARILLFCTLDGSPVGSRLSPRNDAQLVYFVVGAGPLERLELIRGGQVVERVSAQGDPTMQGTISLAGLREGEFLYLRVRQRDGGQAWSSPFFVGGQAATMSAGATEAR